ncbi:MAG: 1-carboxybiuret hydrolase subunit AtzG-like [Solirubrobacteraceae bacterium]|nr:1-carboxybiuret hydrolase subunit AtzG-like [Solirubrobacteraceae bacterium]
MDELDTYARAAARLGALEIEDAWWPGVLRHLAGLFERAALVAAPAPDPAEEGA